MSLLDNILLTIQDDGYETPEEDTYDEFIERNKLHFPDPNFREKNDGLFPLPSDDRLGFSFVKGVLVQPPPTIYLRRTPGLREVFKDLRKCPCPVDKTISKLVYACPTENSNLYSHYPVIFMTKSHRTTEEYRRVMITSVMCSQYFSVNLPIHIWHYILNFNNKGAVYHAVWYREHFIPHNGAWLGVPCIEAKYYDEIADDEKEVPKKRKYEY